MKLSLVLFVLFHSASKALALQRGRVLIEPVPLQDVHLEFDSWYDKSVSLNRDYIMGLDNDRMLKTFRVNAGLDAPGEFLGGWEDGQTEIRGQFMGHWLSSTAMLAKNTGDKSISNKANYLIKELRKVQRALGGGYLSAFPNSHFDRLRDLQPVWAPFYVIHKIMAGLLDHYNFLGNKLALEMVVDEAKFFHGYLVDILQKEGRDHWLQMLEVEYGGMEEVLYNLYEATQDMQWQRMAANFTKPNFFEPLTRNEDVLPGRHANTHLAQVNGFAAGFSTSGSEERRAATSSFFDIITGTHSYATGGSNDGELWGPAFQLGASIAGEGAGRNTEETCTTYNMMKIARYLFQWSGDARYADYYERAILNGMLGVQRMPANYKSQYKTTTSQPISFTRRLMSGGESNADAASLQQVPEVMASGNVTYVPPFTGYNISQAHNWRQEAFKMMKAKNEPVEQGNEPGPGVIIYLMPLGAGNNKGDSWHRWSTPLNSFWCCSGSIVESFGKLMDSIYFQQVPKDSPPELFVNQLTPSSLQWRAGGLNLQLSSEPFNADNALRASIRLSPHSSRSQEALIRLRIPSWVLPHSSTVSLHSSSGIIRSDIELVPGKFVALKRAFEAGDRIEIKFGMKITTEQIVDWHPEFKNLKAIIMGNYVMAALTDHDRDIKADPDKVEEFLHEVSTEGLITLGTEDGYVLRQQNGEVTFIREEACLNGLECTFRLIHKQGMAEADEEPTLKNATDLAGGAVLESMAHPGQFLSVTNQGNLAMERSVASMAPSWIFSSVNSPCSPLEKWGAHETVIRGTHDEAHISKTERSQELCLKSPLGKYPEGAKLLKGDDRSYILAPIGHLIEESYSPYLQFH